ncbi:MAG TPA: hypothetical protein VMU89_24120 [Thermomicrobiaceae bacterium]|nr:hypothetical protein [Thermomicrobiaceae bacterium]
MATRQHLPSSDRQRATGLRPVFERLDGRNVSPLRRFLLGALIVAAGMALDSALSYIWGIQLQALIPVATAIAAGLYVGGWLAIPAAYVGFVGGYILIEGGLFVIMGSSWWAQQHAADSSGPDPAYLKLLGVIAEAAAFSVFFALLSVVGVLARRALGRLAPRG